MNRTIASLAAILSVTLLAAAPAAAMCGGGTQSSGRNQCGMGGMGGMGGMRMGGMGGGMQGMGQPPAARAEAPKPAEPDPHAGMDMSGAAKGGMGNMGMMKMAMGCCGCCGGGGAAGGRAGGMCGGGMGMNMQEDHTKDPLLTDPMWNEKPASPQSTPKQ